jgi:hypothetical protein
MWYNTDMQEKKLFYYWLDLKISEQLLPLYFMFAKMKSEQISVITYHATSLSNWAISSTYTLQSGQWRQLVLLKHWNPHERLHGVTTQKIEIYREKCLFGCVSFYALQNKWREHFVHCWTPPDMQYKICCVVRRSVKDESVFFPICKRPSFIPIQNSNKIIVL